MTIDLDDPFATPEDTRQAKRDSIATGGRYRLPNRDGSHRSGGYQRTTNLASAISDQKALQDWTVTTALAGLATTPALYAELRALIARVGSTSAEIKAARDDLLALSERAKDAAGGGQGRDHGNRVHAIVEAEWSGIPWVGTPEEKALVRQVGKVLAEAQLRPILGMQERIVMRAGLDACGTLDALLDDLVHDLVRIGDTKTQRKFWTWLEVEGQLAFYANAEAMWDPVAGEWVDMPAVDKGLGLALWCPRREPSEDGTLPPLVVEIRPLDLERGWETVQLAHRVVRQRSACKSARQEISGLSWGAASRADAVRRYARLLSSIETRADGSRLFREASRLGIWGPELEQVAREVAPAL